MSNQDTRHGKHAASMEHLEVFEIAALRNMFQEWLFANEVFCVDFRSMYNWLGHQGKIKQGFVDQLITFMGWRETEDFVRDKPGTSQTSEKAEIKKPTDSETDVDKITIKAFLEWADSVGTPRAQEILNEWSLFSAEQDQRNFESVRDPFALPGLFIPDSIANKFFDRWDVFLTREEARRNMAWANEERRRDEMFRIEKEYRMCAHSANVPHEGDARPSPPATQLIPIMQFMPPPPMDISQMHPSVAQQVAMHTQMLAQTSLPQTTRGRGRGRNRGRGGYSAVSTTPQAPLPILSASSSRRTPGNEKKEDQDDAALRMAINGDNWTDN